MGEAAKNRCQQELSRSIGRKLEDNATKIMEKQASGRV